MNIPANYYKILWIEHILLRMDFYFYIVHKGMEWLINKLVIKVAFWHVLNHDISLSPEI